MSERENPLAQLVREAITFADWAAGQGLAPSDPDAPHVKAPEDFLFAYSAATGDEEWETLAERAAAGLWPLLAALAGLVILKWREP